MADSCADVAALSRLRCQPGTWSRDAASWKTAGEGGLRMRLEGSCQCGKVRFRVESETPYPFMYCYCSICRKTTGGAFGVQRHGQARHPEGDAAKHLRVYHAVIRNPRQAAGAQRGRALVLRRMRHAPLRARRALAAKACGRTPARSTPRCPCRPSYVHLMLRYKPKWVQVSGRGPHYPEYPKLSIAEWHDRHGKRVRRAIP